ncbi:MAG TPA: hypothetical protein VF618_02365 [Thermoanaerobaculia bacterium]
MLLRRAVTILVLAVTCALATPTRQSEAEAACFYPFVRIKQHYWHNSCGPSAPAGSICSDVITLVGETGVDCDGNDVSWGYATNYMVTYRRINCPPICD